MTLEDLREQGVLLPEEEWGAHGLDTTVAKVPFAIALLIACGGLALIYVGSGSRTTWVGVAVFLVGLYGVTWISERAVFAQRRRVKREHARRRNGPGGTEGRTGRAPDGERGPDDAGAPRPGA